MSDMVDLTSQVDIKKLSAEEIGFILTGITKSSSIMPDEPNIIWYGDDIKVLFKSNSRKILKISVKNSFYKESRKQILEAFSLANNPLSEKIYSRVVFSAGEELSEQPFRWKGDFQLGRTPDGNPKPKDLYSLYPSLFQFKVPHTDNVWLNNYRAEEVFKKRFLPLIPLLRQYCMISLQYGAKNSNKAWVLTEVEGGVESKYLQVDYFFKSSFSSDEYYQYIQAEIKQLPVFKHDFYDLSSLSVSTGYSAYEKLSIENKEKFLLGCEWFNKAITAHEPTDKFLFMMIMLEIFLPKHSEPCKECNQSIYSINKKFKTYIPDMIGKNWTRDFEKILGQLYSLRSNIAHNGVAVAQYSGGMMPAQCMEQNKLRYLFDLGRQFLVSWLIKMSEK